MKLDPFPNALAPAPQTSACKTKIHNDCDEQKHELGGSDMATVGSKQKRVNDERQGQEDKTKNWDDHVAMQNIKKGCEEPQQDDGNARKSNGQ